jgi:aldose 1-epimerase
MSARDFKAEGTTGSGSALRLRAGALLVELVPEIGGSVASFRKRTADTLVELMRPLSEVARHHRDPEGVAMFPMLPYANRVAHNAFEFEGHHYDFSPNAPDQPLNLHGSGWTHPWTVASVQVNRAELRVERQVPGDPYFFCATQRFELIPNRLRVETHLMNQGTRTMPFGMGLHPWWSYHPDTTVQFRATEVWLEGPDHLPTERITVPSQFDFSCRQALLCSWRNHCYSGWDGQAEIRFGNSGVGLKIQADPLYRHLMFYCDPARGVFCLEPQTHSSGALNRLARDGEEDLGLVFLHPGESLSGAVSFAVLDFESAA